jgi:hypothetical protein
MNKTLKWILIGLGIALAAFVIALVCFRFFGRADFGMMGGRFGGFHRGLGGMLLGVGLFKLFFILIPLGVLTLAVFGVIYLVKNSKFKSLPKAAEQPVLPPAPVRDCVRCGRHLEMDWTTCPYCGKKQ